MPGSSPGMTAVARGRRRFLPIASAWRVRTRHHSAAFAAWVVSLGPLPLAEARKVSTTIVDRNGKLLRAYAMADGRWRLPVDARARRRPRYLKLLLAYEDRRFRSHRGVDPLALGRAALQLVTTRPYCFRRLDHHDATGAADGAAARSARSTPSCVRWCGRSQLERRLSKDQILDLYLALAPVRRQSRRHPRRVDRLFRQGAEAAVAGGSRVAGGAAAVAGTPPARSPSAGGPRRARPRARPHGRGWRGVAGRRGRRPRRSRCRGCASRCRSWRRIPPMRRSRR